MYNKLDDYKLGFVAEVASILKDFKNENVEIGDLKFNDFCDECTLEVRFLSEETARKDFFEFFKNIGYSTYENHNLPEDWYYCEKLDEYPNGADVVPIYATLYFCEGVKEVCYDFEEWELKAR